MHRQVDDADRQMLVYLYLLVTGFHTAVIKSSVIKPAQTVKVRNAARCNNARVLYLAHAQAHCDNSEPRKTTEAQSYPTCIDTTPDARCQVVTQQCVDHAVETHSMPISCKCSTYHANPCDCSTISCQPHAAVPHLVAILCPPMPM